MTDRFVGAGGSDSNDGLSWANHCRRWRNLTPTYAVFEVWEA